MELIVNVFILIISAILIVWTIKVIKQTNSVFEKIVYILYLIAYFTPLVILFLDIYNIPTKFKYIQELDMDRWFNFISNYAISIIGTFISGFILVWITYKQIKSQLETNKEDKRIQNAPLMKYCITNKYVETDNQIYIFSSKGDVYHIFFEVENIGLNHAKHIKIMLSCKMDKWEREFEIDNGQSILKKDAKEWFDLILNFDENGSSRKELEMTILYSDMLNNKYEQKIFILYDVSTKFSKEGRGLTISFVKIDIGEEELKK